MPGGRHSDSVTFVVGNHFIRKIAMHTLSLTKTIGTYSPNMQPQPPLRQEQVGSFTRLASDGKGGVSELLQLLGGSGAAGVADSNMPVAVRRKHEGESLFHEGGTAEGLYFVRAGTFKVFRTGEDGYEQVLGFAGRGELLGFDAVGLRHYTNEAVALEESSVYVVLLQDYFSVNPRIPELDGAVFRAVSAALQQSGEMAEMMAAVAAETRLARFLLQLSRRMAASGQSASRLHLRMGRRDIASYLGVAHETVSRSFTSLVATGLVSVNNRDVEILDMAGLREFGHGTRRQSDDGARKAEVERHKRGRPATRVALAAAA